MSDSNQSFLALMFGAAGLLLLGGLDAFWFHRFGVWFDEGCVVTFATICGAHWVFAPALPIGQAKAK
jgi:hypothetical protein